MSKHTPGPWHQGTDPRRIEASDGLIVANVSGGIQAPSVIGDARLIAAAPELLETLMRYVQHDREIGIVENNLYRTAVAAIAKATGDQA